MSDLTQGREQLREAVESAVLPLFASLPHAVEDARCVADAALDALGLEQVGWLSLVDGAISERWDVDVDGTSRRPVYTTRLSLSDTPRSGSASPPGAPQEQDLAEALAELERTNPEVAAASHKVDEAVADIIGRSKTPAHPTQSEGEQE